MLKRRGEKDSVQECREGEVSVERDHPKEGAPKQQASNAYPRIQSERG